MKAFLLTVATFLAVTGSMFAQNLPPEYLWEVGVNGGYSVITRPLGPSETYQGRRTKFVGDFSARLNYYINPNWMLNLDLGMRKWETFDTWEVNGLFGKQLKAQDVSFLIASKALSQSIGINYVIPFYTRYNNYNKCNIYFGAMAGMVQTMNDGSTEYSKYKTAQDSGYNYVSSYHYGPGIGYNFGIQMGFTYYIVPRLGVNVDLSMRYARVNTTDINYRDKNSFFYLLYFPETIGIRWRF